MLHEKTSKGKKNKNESTDKKALSCENMLLPKKKKLHKNHMGLRGLKVDADAWSQRDSLMRKDLCPRRGLFHGILKIKTRRNI